MCQENAELRERFQSLMVTLQTQPTAHSLFSHLLHLKMYTVVVIDITNAQPILQHTNSYDICHSALKETCHKISRKAEFPNHPLVCLITHTMQPHPSKVHLLIQVEIFHFSKHPALMSLRERTHIRGRSPPSPNLHYPTPKSLHK